MKIAINAGHCCSKDSGAIGATGLQEAEVNYRIGQLVAYYLQQANYDTLQIHENELKDICDISNNFGADLFVSIHCNAAENISARGTETFCFMFDTKSHSLAKCVQSQIIDTVDLVDRGVKADRFYVLKNTDCPAILVECAFISNLDDEELLASEEGKDDFARAIAVGITNYVAKL